MGQSRSEYANICTDETHIRKFHADKLVAAIHAYSDVTTSEKLEAITQSIWRCLIVNKINSDITMRPRLADADMRMWAKIRAYDVGSHITTTMLRAEHDGPGSVDDVKDQGQVYNKKEGTGNRVSSTSSDRWSRNWGWFVTDDASLLLVLGYDAVGNYNDSTYGEDMNLANQFCASKGYTIPIIAVTIANIACRVGDKGFLREAMSAALSWTFYTVANPRHCGCVELFQGKPVYKPCPAFDQELMSWLVSDGLGGASGYVSRCPKRDQHVQPMCDMLETGLAHKLIV
ncbi:hypothetical protein BGX26_005939, partial [Mortierella sp. AD094]